MTKRNDHFPYLSPVALPRVLPTSLPRTVYEPMKDRAYRIMIERINPGRIILNGKR